MKTMGMESRRRLLADTIKQNDHAARETRSQALFDELLAALQEEGEITLGCCVAFLHGLRIAGQDEAAFFLLVQMTAQLRRAGYLDESLERLRRREETFGGPPAGG